MAPVDVRNRLEQIRKNKNKNNKNKKVSSDSNVKDLRQLIAKKTRGKGGGRNDRSPDRTAKGRITKHSGASRDLRDTSRKLASRRAVSQSRDKPAMSTRNDKLNSRAVHATTRSIQAVSSRRAVVNDGQLPVRVGRKIVHQQQYYMPPHMQRNQPAYMIASSDTPKSNMVMSNAPESQLGASVLVSNLAPNTITQSDIIELFGEVGVMTAVSMINQSTALVSYRNASDAVRAVKIYNERQLDGRPMLVNMMPNSI